MMLLKLMKMRFRIVHELTQKPTSCRINNGDLLF